MKNQKKEQPEQDQQIMTDENFIKNVDKKNLEKLDDYCEECKKEHFSVSQTLILTGYKICSFCITAKTIFPI